MQFPDLIGKTLKNVTNNADKEILFETSDGETYRLYHDQDCCEYVSIESIVGDLSDLLDAPIIVAEEVSNKDGPVPEDHYIDDSYTWTFYKIDTIKGGVTIRWLGTSNGYYSESVSFIKDAQ